MGIDGNLPRKPWDSEHLIIFLGLGPIETSVVLQQSAAVSIFQFSCLFTCILIWGSCLWQTLGNP